MLVTGEPFITLYYMCVPPQRFLNKSNHFYDLFFTQNLLLYQCSINIYFFCNHTGSSEKYKRQSSVVLDIVCSYINQEQKVSVIYHSEFFDIV